MSDGKVLDLKAIEALFASIREKPWTDADGRRARESEDALVAEVKRLRDRIGVAQAALEDCRRHHIDPRDHEEVIP